MGSAVPTLQTVKIVKFDPEKLNEKMHKPIIVGLALFVVVALCVNDLPNYINGLRAYNWPVLEGTIRDKKIEPYKMGTATGFTNTISYVYKTQSKVCFGTRIRFQPKVYYDGLETAAFEKDYFIGKKVQVSYDPDNPEISCLKAGASLSKVFSQLVIYLILSITIYFSIYPRLEKVEVEESQKVPIGQ